jgi:Cu/Ag efflux protein CusF
LAALLLWAGALAAAGPALAPVRQQGRGVIRQVKEEGRVLVIAHERIAGFMPAMTMAFAVADPALARGLKAGDSVAFTLTHQGDFWPITALKLRPAPQGRPARTPAAGAGHG